MLFVRWGLVCLALLCSVSCSTLPPEPSSSLSLTGAKLKGWQKPYNVMGVAYTPLLAHEGFVERGLASWYGIKFHGRKTSNGEIYDMYAMTAAHKTLPLGVFVRVENQNNGLVDVVRVNDRGPFVAGRIIDLSYAAAKKLAVVGPGTAPVVITALGYRHTGADGMLHYALPESIHSGPFAVQVGAFIQQENALRLQVTLQRLYGHADMREVQVRGQRFFRVRAGHYVSLAEAMIGQEALAQSGYGSGFVVAID
ncbi:MAG: septal ring lytic transglycosylase RlpA family protein [Thermodesulfobacteriota bacterium]|nr:septal ring lytic transglycosylase RlpA family protein [Thermodesulfobacteriota bacterium]